MPSPSIRARLGWRSFRNSRMARMAVGTAIARLTYRLQRHERGLGEHAAEQQPDRRPSGRDRAEDAKRLRTVRRSLEGHGQQAERRGGQDRAEGSLEGPGGDEHAE